MFEVVFTGLACLFDELGECQPVRQPGQAVAQHFGAQSPFGLHLHRAVDQAE